MLIRPLCAAAETAWTKQEIKDMMAMLKEQGNVPSRPSCAAACSRVTGMAAFVAEYIVRRAIPIPKLLYAFNVCLVRLSVRPSRATAV